jgi:hypothetical protein
MTKQPEQKLIFKISNKPVLRILIPVVVFPGCLEVENITHGGIYPWLNNWCCPIGNDYLYIERGLLIKGKTRGHRKTVRESLFVIRES